MMVFNDVVRRFHKEYNGKPLSVFIVGGGYSLLDILKYPGGSRFVDQFIAPYSEGSIRHWVLNNKGYFDENIGKCNQEATKIYYQTLERISLPTTIQVVVNAALTTNRYRQGKNRAHIIINGDYYLKEIDKFPEDIHNDLIQNHIDSLEQTRYNEDLAVSKFVLDKLLTRYNEPIVQEVKS